MIIATIMSAALAVAAQFPPVTSLPLECEKVVTVSGKEPSWLPEAKKFKLIWNDEFDGDKLDMTKWSFRTNFWGSRFTCFADENDTDAVKVEDSLLYLYVREKDGRFYSPHLQTGALVYDGPKTDDGKAFWPYAKREKPKFMHKYGYYECRAKTQRERGWWSAFWLQSPDVGATLNPTHSGIECDIMECFTPGRIIPSAMHYNGYGADYRGFQSDRGSGNIHSRALAIDQDEFHVYGCLWEPDGYTFYIDGRRKGPKIGHGEGEAVSDTEQFILVSTECHSYRRNGKPESKVLSKAVQANDAFVIDYVRVFDIVPEN